MRGERSLIRAIRGPVTLITVGVLFAFNNFTEYRFDQTWPVILIVFGLMSLLGRSTERFVQPPPGTYPSPGTYPQPGTNPSPGTYPPPPPNFPPAGGYAQGSYSQTPYAQPANPAKGGFGSSAAPRPADPNNPGGPQ